MRTMRPASLLAAGFSLLYISNASASTSFPRSIAPVEASSTAKIVSSTTYGRIVRTTLTAEEMAATIEFEFALKLPNRDELEARVSRGETFSREALEPYLPTAADYARVRAWLVAQGFEITLDPSFRHAIFARGSYAQVSAALGVNLARVATTDGEFTSAVTAPSLPDDIGAAVDGIRGLQPLIRHPHFTKSPPLTQTAANANRSDSIHSQQLEATSYYAIAPGAIAATYHFPTNVNGTGETIAIVGASFPTATDITTFWSQCGVSQSWSNISFINVDGGPGSNTNDQFELSMDSEWTSGEAPGAQVRIYGAPWPLTNVTEEEAYAQILGDLASFPSIHQVTESYGGSEFNGDQDSSLILLIAQGVTCFASSGDGGTNPDDTGVYESTSPVSINYPGSDPSMTGVGGTILNFPVADVGVYVPPEITWSVSGNGTNGTGGGISTLFTRPSWQVGTGLPGGTMRCEPDVSAMAFYSAMGALVIQGGDAYYGGGTSLASPIWAGFLALVNQGRASGGLAPVGFLNPKIYPQLGTSSFTDILTGNNGLYSAGTGYDLCTGIGSPVGTNMVTYLNTVATAPWIYAQPASVATVAGRAVQFTATVGGYPQPTYQWQVSANGGASWQNLSNGGLYSTVQTATLGISDAEVAISGYEFRLVSTDSTASVTSSAVTMTVTSPPIGYTVGGQPGLLWTDTSTGNRVIWLMSGTNFSSNVSLGNVALNWIVSGVADFNGDGHPDILWTNTTTGERVIWLMNGTAYSSSVSLGVVPLNLSISGVGAFGGGTQPDIVFTDTTTGQRLIWLMSGTSYSSTVALGVVPAEQRISAIGNFYGAGVPGVLMTNAETNERTIWQLTGAHLAETATLGVVAGNWELYPSGLDAVELAKLDFNGDGQPDILFENTATGDHYVWLMDGLSFASSVFLGNVSTQWQVAATGDFSGSGSPDLLWQNSSTGQVLIWVMDGTTYISSVSLGTVPAGWIIDGVGDFNGDGSPDIVWSNTSTGQRLIWLMNGTTFASSVSLGTMGTQWRIADTADFFGTGQPDLVWENTSTGDRYIWLMNGTAFSSSVYLGNVGTQWRIVSTEDFSGAGQPDIVFENTTTGDRYIWLMSGTTFGSSYFLGNVATQWEIRN
jgi:kumamolisin